MLGVNFVTCFFPYKHESSVRIARVEISSYGDTWPPAGAQSLLVTVINVGASILAWGQREKVAKGIHFLLLLIKGKTDLVFLDMNPGVILSHESQDSFPLFPSLWIQVLVQYWTLFTCRHSPLGFTDFYTHQESLH